MGSDTIAPIARAGIWIVANLLGFWLGWEVAGNDAGAGVLEGSARNAFYGLAFGTAQMAALWIAWRPAHRRLLLWPLATALAFTAGVLFWRVSYRVPGYELLPVCLRLGVPLSVLMPLGQGWALRYAFPHISPRDWGLWLGADCAMWLILEFVACLAGYAGLRIPIAVIVATVPTALAIALMRGSSSTEKATVS